MISLSSEAHRRGKRDRGESGVKATSYLEAGGLSSSPLSGHTSFITLSANDLYVLDMVDSEWPDFVISLLI